MAEYFDEEPPSCGFTVLGIVAASLAATIPMISLLLIDIDNPLALFTFLLSMIFAVTIIMLGAWWAMKRFRKWVTHKAESQPKTNEY